MVECGDGLGLCQEPHDRGFTAGSLAKNPFDRDLAAQPRVRGE